jgi:F0F1-type ATP synthase alpha subunit
MTFKNNITELKSYVSKSPVDNKMRIRKIIELYENKKIVNFKTALNNVLLLSSKNKNTINSGRAIKEYNQIVNKYDEKEPMTGRLKNEVEKIKKIMKSKEF